MDAARFERPMAVKKQSDGARGRRCVGRNSFNCWAEQHPCHCTAKMMHPLTLVFIVFCISCVAVNVGQLVPLFASDRWGPDLGGQESLQLLLGAHIPRSPFLSSETGRQNLVKVEIDVAANHSVHKATAARSHHLSADEEVFVCDRSNYRADVCYIRGDVRMRGDSRAIVLHTRMEDTGVEETETIQPITRKWERSTMQGVENITLSTAPASTAVKYKCDVRHTKPAIVFSTAGFTGNVYHDFNDVLIPLFITAQHYKGEVVFVVSDYRGWWWARYIRLLKQFSKYKRIVFQSQRKTYCFSEATVGLHIHGELTVDPTRMPNGETIKDFQMLLAKAYDNSTIGSSNRSSGKGRLNKGSSILSQQLRHKRVSPLADLEEDTTDESRDQEPELTTSSLRSRGKPRLVLILRHGSRVLLNQKRVVKMAQDLGFEVKKLAPGWYMDLRRMYQVMHSADVVMGVHGAALTHLLFMRPGTVFIQIVPMGTALPASQYYGEPAVKCGLQYLEYKITALESSLMEKYPKEHPVLADPASIVGLGWDKVKEVYLDDQNVRPDIRQLRSLLLHAKNLLPPTI